MLQLLVGLGNPGTRYRKNRHNLGWRVLEQLAAREAVAWRESTQWASTSFVYEKQKIWLLKPLTYMNLSGSAVVVFSRKKGIPPENILVIHDEIALPLGQLRLKTQGGPGGHNGLSSVIVSLQTEIFPRLRLGIGAPPSGVDLASYVLANFLAEEEAVAASMLTNAVDVCLETLRDGVPKTMSRLNRRPQAKAPAGDI